MPQQLQIIDAKTGQQLLRLGSGNAELRDYCWIGGGRIAAINRSMLGTWDATTGTLVKWTEVGFDIELDGEPWTSNIAWVPGTEIIAVTDADGNVHLWDMSTGKFEKAFELVCPLPIVLWRVSDQFLTITSHATNSA